IPGRGIPDISWHGEQLEGPAWQDRQGQFLRFTVAGQSADEEDLHVILNMSERVVDATLPPIPGRRWQVALDPARPTPTDIVPRGEQRPHDRTLYSTTARSIVVLEARA